MEVKGHHLTVAALAIDNVDEVNLNLNQGMIDNADELNLNLNLGMRWTSIQIWWKAKVVPPVGDGGERPQEVPGGRGRVKPGGPAQQGRVGNADWGRARLLGHTARASLRLSTVRGQAADSGLGQLLFTDNARLIGISRLLRLSYPSIYHQKKFKNKYQLIFFVHWISLFRWTLSNVPE